MSFQSPGPTESLANSARTTAAEPLSQSGQLLGWGIYGTLLVIGFAFGIVTGYERPKTIAQAKATSDKDQANSDSPKPDTKTTAKVALPTEPSKTQSATTAKDVPSTTPDVTPKSKVDPKPPMPMTTTPMNDLKPPMPMTTTPPKTDPPKPPMPTAITPPPTDIPKKEDLKAVSFKTDVLPILRTHCLNCHGAVGKPKGNVDLRTLASLKNSPSENNKILVSTKPDESDFYTSITQRGMPKDRPPLSEKELLVLKNWILTGAKERRRIIRGRKRAA
ncbi:MAG TPA: c-type cytochrome domain-containing protein [Gemmata sp.]|jgi:hypothetical protein|nr:c-type cytochrome domain-containing protein [Gemmata sp.]